VLKRFLEYEWPGNIRELQNALEQICILCKSDTITIDDLPIGFAHGVKTQTSTGAARTTTPREILRALAQSGWNKTLAARLLGISRRTLYRRIQEHQISKDKLHH